MVEPRGGFDWIGGLQARADPRPAQLRIATIDRDGEFLRRLAREVGRLEWTLVAHPGPVGADALLNGHPHAVLVDVALLGPRWDVWIAHQASQVPHVGMLVCTGASTVRQRIRGLHAGADDWLTKPCDVEEVTARLLAIVRARRLHLAGAPPAPLRGAELEIRPDLYDAFVAARPAGLTRREFDVLLSLARRRGQALDRSRLYSEVWGYTMVRGDRSVDTFVRKIRVKLREVSPEWRYIHTHKGLGYRFEAELLKQARRP